MKIRRIRLQNLNSLKGEHCIDLTQEPLASAGLFAITGPTGAGKSTLLDALTLALYGKAARYGNESNPEHVMSRHCGECSAEVEFEVPSGIYRAVWQRHRSRKKADGALQAPKRYIYDAEGEPLAQQIREAEAKIEELLGLNYDRFLRSVLLAQGEFARFLKANANERAELLESLTGTDIYSRLGIRAFDEADRRESELKAKESAFAQIPLLEPEAREQLTAEHAAGEARKRKLASELAAAATLLGQIKALEEARGKETRAAAMQAKVSEERKASAADFKRLQTHRLTLPFAEDLARLGVAETACTAAQAKRRLAEAAQGKAQALLAERNQILRAALETTLRARQAEARKAGEGVKAETKAEADALAWLKQHAADGVLADQLADLSAALVGLHNARRGLGRAWSDWRKAAEGILPEGVADLPADLEKASAPALEATLAAFLGAATAKQEALLAAGNEARKQLTLRKDHLQKTRLVASLADHRAALKPGEACPLCGALEHPYAEGAIPNIEIAQLDAEVHKAEKDVEAKIEHYRNFTSTLKNLSAGQSDLLERLRERDVVLATAAEHLVPLALEVPAPGAEDTALRAIKAREQAYRQFQKAAEEAARRRAEAMRAVNEATKEADQLAEMSRDLPPLPAGIELPPVDVARLPQVPEAVRAHQSAVTDAQTRSAQLQDRRDDETKASQALAQLKPALEQALAASPLGSLEGLRAARLAPAEANDIEAREHGLKERATTAEALLKQARTDISQLLKADVPEGEPAATLKARHTELNHEREELIAAQTTRANALKQDDTNRKRREEGEAELKEERARLAVWRHLRELIGSRDGNKFRRHAQSISLDILTRHANRHLALLSDRYRIRRDEDEVLTLQIEDLDQAGTRRPMASLSGGESFLASLALALGLSDLAGRTVRIDSLFIDEGFGSLDGDTLEVALASLESLRQDHKTVGVISHVDLLKERIGTQIIVEKSPGGVSHIRIVPPVSA